MASTVTNSFVKPEEGPSRAARYLPTLLIIINMLLGAYAGAALMTAARLEWDPSTELVARRLLAERHARVAESALALAAAALLLLAALALLALHCSRCCRLSLLLLYTFLMIAMVAAELMTARRVVPELEERMEAAHELVRSLAVHTAHAFKVLDHEVVAGVADIANSVGEAIKTLPTLPSLPDLTVPTLPELPELPEIPELPQLPDLRSQEAQETTAPASSPPMTLKMHSLSSSQSSSLTQLSSSKVVSLNSRSTETTVPPLPSPPTRVAAPSPPPPPARTLAPRRRRPRSVENIKKFGHKFQTILLDVDRDLPINLTVAKVAALCLVVLQITAIVLAALIAFGPRRPT